MITPCEGGKFYNKIAHFVLKITPFFIIVIVFLFASKISLGQIAFSSPVIYKNDDFYTNTPKSRVSDVNNDGFNDVIIACNRNVYIYVQDTLGQLRPPVKYFGSDYDLAVGDMNNDKLNDVITPYGDSICVLFQNTSDTLKKKMIYAGKNNKPYIIRSLDIGDLNNDGLNDIAVTTQSDYEASFLKILYQQNDGNFLIASSPLVIFSYKIIIADINDDNLNDIILKDHNIGIAIYYQNSDGTIDNNIIISDEFPNSIEALAIGDLNNDGKNDLVKTLFANYPENLLIHFQDPISHSLQTPIILKSASTQSIEISDLNCDSKNEIIISDYYGNLNIFEQDENNNYNSFIEINYNIVDYVGLDGLSVGDLNNDGKNDLAIASSYGLIILHNISTPKMPQIIGSAKVCEENEISSYQTSFDFNGTITWNLCPLEAGTIINSTNNSCEIAWNNDFRGEIELYLIGTNDCSTGYSESFFIIDSRLPKLDLGADKILCTNDSTLLHANTDFTSYKWNDNSTDTTLLVKVGGEYFVEATHICGIAYDTIQVIEKQPQINLPEDPTLCKGTNILFDVSLAGNNQYLWQNGSQFPFYNVESAGVYSVTITDEYNCKNEKTVIVSEITPPIWKLSIDTSFCSGDILTLDVLCEDCNYIWQDASTLPQFEITETGIYSVEVYNFCDTISKSINATALDCDTYFAVPSAFSPNNDNNNDELFAVGKNIENINFKIFDRWGNIVFETTDINKGWDGTYKGKKLETNVFMYFATAKSLIDGKTLQTQGNVSLIR